MVLETTKLIERIKVLKSITNDSADAVINELILNATTMICLYINEDKLPNMLEPVLVNMVREEMTTLTDEGLSGYSVPGQSFNFLDRGVLRGYESVLDRYIRLRDGQSLGVYVLGKN